MEITRQFLATETKVINKGDFLKHSTEMQDTMGTSVFIGWYQAIMYFQKLF